MATLSRTEVAKIGKLSFQLIQNLLNAPDALRRARVLISAIRPYLSAIEREAGNPGNRICTDRNLKVEVESLLGGCMGCLERGDG